MGGNCWKCEKEINPNEQWTFYVQPKWFLNLSIWGRLGFRPSNIELCPDCIGSCGPLVRMLFYQVLTHLKIIDAKLISSPPLRWNDPLRLSVRHFATDRELETHPGPRPCQYCRHIHYHPSFSPPHTSHFLVDSSSQDPAAIINIRGVRGFPTGVFWRVPFIRLYSVLPFPLILWTSGHKLQQIAFIWDTFHSIHHRK